MLYGVTQGHVDGSDAKAASDDALQTPTSWHLSEAGPSDRPACGSSLAMCHHAPRVSGSRIQVFGHSAAKSRLGALLLAQEHDRLGKSTNSVFRIFTPAAEPKGRFHMPSYVAVSVVGHPAEETLQPLWRMIQETFYCNDIPYKIAVLTGSSGCQRLEPRSRV